MKLSSKEGGLYQILVPFVVQNIGFGKAKWWVWKCSMAMGAWKSRTDLYKEKCGIPQSLLLKV